MTSAIVSRWSRAFVAGGVGWFVLAQLAAAANLGRRTVVVLGLYGFVFHVVFGKAYSLVPTYFARELAAPRAMALHLPLATLATAGLAAGALGIGPDATGDLGAISWLAGCLVFVGTLAWTVRDNPTGRETGTGAVNDHRRRVDRVANAFVPIVLAYLLAGASLPVLRLWGVELPWFPATGPAVSHLLAAGTGALLVFAVGFRLLPRFLVATPRIWLVLPVLTAGAIAPALLAIDFLGGTAFRAGAVLLALAIVGFAASIGDMYVRSDRRRVGFEGVLAGAISGVLAVTIALHVAFAGPEASLLEAHVRLALTGFLGVTIVGVTYQFYPPGIAETRGVGDRTARLSIAAIFGGVLTEAGARVATGAGAVETEAAATLVQIGATAGVVGAALYAFVLFVLFYERWG